MRKTVISAALAFCVAVSGSGCALMGLGRQLKTLTTAAHVRGVVESDVKTTSPIAVVAYKEEDGKRKVVQYRWLRNAGKFHFVLPPGRYRFFAFEDTNSNCVYDSGEAAAYPKDPERFLLIAERVSDLVIPLSHQKPEFLDWPLDLTLQTGGTGTSRQKAMIGEIVSLDDPRFDDKSGSMGLWKFAEFHEKVGGGIFFLEEYDKEKIPLLFIHGYIGTPRDFKFIVEHLDRKRFQPWFVFYPSAVRFGMVSEFLTTSVNQLQMKYKFKRLYVVGYSAGGLIGRAMILKSDSDSQEHFVRKFISIATPWSGHKLADLRNMAPTEVPSWEDLAKNSRFLKGLFGKPLPEETKYYLFFGYRGSRVPFSQNNDEFITIESALYRPAQEEAVKIYGFNSGHCDIVDNIQLCDALNKILEGPDGGA